MRLRPAAKQAMAPCCPITHRTRRSVAESKVKLLSRSSREEQTLHLHPQCCRHKPWWSVKLSFFRLDAVDARKS